MTGKIARARTRERGVYPAPTDQRPDRVAPWLYCIIMDSRPAFVAEKNIRLCTSWAEATWAEPRKPRKTITSPPSE